MAIKDFSIEVKLKDNKLKNMMENVEKGRHSGVMDNFCKRVGAQLAYKLEWTCYPHKDVDRYFGGDKVYLFSVIKEEGNFPEIVFKFKDDTLYISSHNLDKKDVLTVQKAIDNSCITKNFNCEKINIKDVYLNDIIMKDLMDSVKRASSFCVSMGYSREKEQIRDSLMRIVLTRVNDDFPELSDKISVTKYQGLGYYNQYSDFSVNYDEMGLISVRTGESTVKRVNYKPEFYDYDDVCKFYEIKNVDDMTVRDFSTCVKKYDYLTQRWDLEKQISDLKNKIRILQDDIHKVDIALKSCDTVDLSVDSKKNQSKGMYK